MTGHVYAVGDRVCIQSGFGGRGGGFDTVKRVTAASVITENSGAFRLASKMYDDRLTRNSTGAVYTTYLFPEHHQQFAAAGAEARMKRRQAAVIGRRIPGGLADPIQTWISTGNDATFNDLVEFLRIAHRNSREES